MAADYLWSGLYSRIRRKGKHVPVRLILRRIHRRTVQPPKAAQEARDFSRERFTTSLTGLVMMDGKWLAVHPQTKVMVHPKA